MSPKIKSVLSVVVLVFLGGFFLFKYLGAFIGVVVSPIGLILSILILLFIPLSVQNLSEDLQLND